MGCNHEHVYNDPKWGPYCGNENCRAPLGGKSQEKRNALILQESWDPTVVITSSQQENGQDSKR